MPIIEDSAPDPTGIEGVVELQVPASSAFVAVLRSVTAGLAARCDLTLDEIEDLRIAVDEACALLVPLAAAGMPLRTSFTLSEGELVIETRVLARPGAYLARNGFGWTVLQALVNAVEAGPDPAGSDELRIALTKRRGPAAQ